MTAEETLFIQQLLEERDRLFQENANLKSRLDHLHREGEHSAILQSTPFQTQLDYYEQRAHEAISALSGKEAIIEKQEQALHSKDKTITAQQEQILYLKHQVDKLRRMIWGQKSEKYIPEDPLQRRLDFEGLDVLPEEKGLASSIADEIKAYKESRIHVRKQARPVRRPLPEDLERVINEITPEEVTDHEDEYVEVEPETREVLVYTPGRCYVRKDIRRKFIPKDKHKKAECPVITAPLPMLPLAKSYADASLLAELVIGKFAYHLPFYRQAKMFRSLGVDLPESTIAGWREAVADLLRPTWYRLLELIMATDYVQADETTIPIVKKEKKKTIKGYLWMVRSPIAGLTAFYYDHG